MTLYPNDYWAAQPLEVQALRTMTDLTERFAKGMELAKAGYTIDRAIMIDQEMLPEDVMRVRVNNGFRWVPAADQANIPTMPGADLPGLTPYDPTKPPPGSIHVPFVADDYAHGPTKPPVPAPVPATKPQVGEGFQTEAGLVFLPGPGLNQNLIAEGSIVNQNGVEYVAHVDNTKRFPIWFTKV